MPGFEGAALLEDGDPAAFAGGYRQHWWDGSDHLYLAEMAVRRATRHRPSH